MVLFSRSNDLSLPLIRRLRVRLDELKEIGYTRFQKGDDGEHHEIPAEMFIQGPVSFGLVRKINEDHYEIKYRTYKTEKGPNGFPKKVRVLLDPNSDEKNGTMTEVVDKEVVETFKKGKPFSSKTTLLETAGLASFANDPGFKKHRRSILTGGDSETPETEPDNDSESVVSDGNPLKPKE